MNSRELAFRLENVSKMYRVGRLNTDPTLRESLANAASRPAQALISRISRLRGHAPRVTSKKAFWALKDISFEVRQGEVLGIIGHNGAGKSTLLKILCRITSPTAGRIEMYGHVGSLLEVGTGFHPELTGRENVYLNGAILGMSRKEITRKFDEIVAFSEIERFLDTPVKRYSSGMYVRLAFAVAAHLEPEILLIDEVLAVGDTAFQKKCLGKMDSVARQGRTVLFVSHNLGAIRALCSRTIMLRGGRIFADGDTAAVVSKYLGTLEEAASVDLIDRRQRTGAGHMRFKMIEISSVDEEHSSILATGKRARFAFQVTDVQPGMSCSFTIYDEYGHPVTFFDSAMEGPEDLRHPGGNGQFVCEVEDLLLLPGRYRLNAALMCDGVLQDHLEAAAFIDVQPGLLRGRSTPSASRHGRVLLNHRWIRFA